MVCVCREKIRELVLRRVDWPKNNNTGRSRGKLIKTLRKTIKKNRKILELGKISV